jgi:hypothetical protein
MCKEIHSPSSLNLRRKSCSVMHLLDGCLTACTTIVWSHRCYSSPATPNLHEADRQHHQSVTGQRQPNRISNLISAPYAGCETRWTAWTVDDGWLGNLDRHRLTCNGGEGLKGFQLERRNGLDTRYRYLCCSLGLLASQNTRSEFGQTTDEWIHHPWYAGSLSNHNINCTKVGSILQHLFMFQTYQENRLWKNCVAWNDVCCRQHNDWCQGEFGPYFSHSMSGTGEGCWSGFGRGNCYKPPKFSYHYQCLDPAPGITPLYERRACRSFSTNRRELVRTHDLSFHHVYCPDDTLLTQVQWVTDVTNMEFYTPKSGEGRYSYTCCGFDVPKY